MINAPDDDLAFEAIRELASGLEGLNRRAVEEYTPLVEEIVQFGNRDAQQIERTLDGLLDFCGSAAALALYKKLCRHYWHIDPTAAADYVRFMQMILRYGRSGVRYEILTAKSVETMSVNQIGGLRAGILKSFQPDRSSDVDVHPGEVDRWGLGFLINPVAYPGGRSAGSLAWAGINNTFYWIDPERGICSVIMMQFLPFVDKEAVGLLGDFERAVYANL